MASFVLSLHSSPSHSNSVINLVQFANTCLQQAHEIKAIFLYQDAVWHASSNFMIPTDEYQFTAQWHTLSDAAIPLLLCVTAAEKRGLDLSSCSPFQVAGLAEFAMTAATADKWVQFK
ncbi:sulfurtransferase complex subunit TusD [Pseudoalteromonas tunicata]|uniref:sulfurtransferase complex subunit TusD n=1 Tax=Pseudoalteromonas tunicata TaxID=314281 RepID=UPI00273EFECA|nr:sulfurtransferase complex subunit TusD [Pseudoalteromonas tunicata]MDP5212187.1 sulfurtransferase complex subunit TusD [Pseudoalteromonas tunicata]